MPFYQYLMTTLPKRVAYDIKHCTGIVP